jgi:hypothetical protein
VFERAYSTLRGERGVHSVEANPKTGSVLVEYDHTHHTRDGILGILRDVALISVEAVGGEEQAQSPETGHSATATNLLTAVNDIDRRIAEITGHAVDLRILVPLGLVTLGAILVVTQGGLGLAAIPPFLLFWYAFDSFVQLHRRQTAQAEAVAA